MRCSGAIAALAMCHMSLAAPFELLQVGAAHPPAAAAAAHPPAAAAAAEAVEAVEPSAEVSNHSGLKA